MIIIIDNFDSFTYNLYQQVASLTPNVKVLTHDVELNTIMALQPQGIILSPGPGRPTDAGICLPLVRALLRANIPVFRC